MLFDETLTLDSPRRTEDGSLVASVLAARTGIQDYAGYEVGKPEMARVSVYRPEASVFNRDSMASFASAPVTLEHPPVPVIADNWRQYAVGDLGEDVVRDGEAVRVPLIVRDAAAIDAGKREISMGYSCELEFVDGVTPDGQTYQAIQRNIKVNHLAIVDRARGGSKLRIGDRREAASPLNGEMTVATKIITFDGLPLEVTDAAEAALLKRDAEIKALKDAATAADAAHATALAAKDAKIATLDAEVATLKPQILTGDALDKAIAARTKLIGDAKKVAGDALVVDGKTDAEIKKAAVLAKLGDAYADRDATFFDAAFELQLAQAPAPQTKDGVAVVVASGTQPIADAAKQATDARTAAEEAERNAWRPKAA